MKKGSDNEKFVSVQEHVRLKRNTEKLQAAEQAATDMKRRAQQILTASAAQRGGLCSLAQELLDRSVEALRGALRPLDKPTWGCTNPQEVGEPAPAPAPVAPLAPAAALEDVPAPAEPAGQDSEEGGQPLEGLLASPGGAQSPERPAPEAVTSAGCGLPGWLFSGPLEVRSPRANSPQSSSALMSPARASAELVAAIPGWLFRTSSSEPTAPVVPTEPEPVACAETAEAVAELPAEVDPANPTEPAVADPVDVESTPAQEAEALPGAGLGWSQSDWLSADVTASPTGDLQVDPAMPANAAANLGAKPGWTGVGAPSLGSTSCWATSPGTAPVLGSARRSTERAERGELAGGPMTPRRSLPPEERACLPTMASPAGLPGSLPARLRDSPGLGRLPLSEDHGDRGEGALPTPVGRFGSPPLAGEAEWAELGDLSAARRW